MAYHDDRWSCKSHFVVSYCLCESVKCRLTFEMYNRLSFRVFKLVVHVISKRYGTMSTGYIGLISLPCIDFMEYVRGPLPSEL